MRQADRAVDSGRYHAAPTGGTIVRLVHMRAMSLLRHLEGLTLGINSPLATSHGWRRFRTGSVSAAVVLLLSLTPGCRYCDDIGCVNILTVSSPNGLLAEAKACVVDACVALHDRNGSDPVTAIVESEAARKYLEQNGRVVVRIEIDGRATEKKVRRLKLASTNSCSGVCYRIVVVLNPSGEII